MKSLLVNKYLLMISRIILGFVFLYAAVEKIADPSAFGKAIYNYKLFPEAIIYLFAVVIPWIELVAGMLLIFNVSARENAVILTSLLGIFIVLIIVSISRGLNIECGCFGTASGSTVGWQKVGENVLLMALGFFIILSPAPAPLNPPEGGT